MTNQFDWDFEEINEEDYQEITPKKASSRPVWLYVLIPILLLAGGGYWFVQTQFQKLSTTQLDALSSLLNTQQTALAEEDFDLYFSLANATNSWKIKQLDPVNRAFFASEPTIKAISEEGPELWVTLAGELDNEPVERTLFFLHSQGVATEQIGKSLLYWGEERTESFAWGTLVLNERDRAFENDIVDTVEAAIGEFEGGIEIRVVTDSERPFSPNTLYVPSPRLIGLTPDGNLSNAYRTQLSNKVAKFVASTKTPIRFAIPDNPNETNDSNYTDLTYISYTALAETFTAETGIPVELITITESDADTLSIVDAATITPTVDLIMGGHLYDLTDFAFGDVAFEVGDFYSEFWDGASWRERIWMIPQEAEMHVLFYAKEAYRQRELAFPTVNWTWDNLVTQTKALADPSDARYEIHAGLLSPNNDLLYAYAFSNFPDGLNQEAIDATLDWYRSLEATKQALPLSELADDEARAFETLQHISYPPDVGLWTGKPNIYEYFIQYLPVSVMPFPASDSTPSSPPLYITGYVMSSATQNPYNTWAWLNFLSRQPPIIPSDRGIPARQSVAANADHWPRMSGQTEGGFWSSLPAQLNAIMHKTFDDAQAIPIDKQDVFSWEVIAREAASEEAIRKLESNNAVAPKLIPPKITVASVNDRLSQIQWDDDANGLVFLQDFADYAAGESGWLRYKRGNSVANPVLIEADLLQAVDGATQAIAAVSSTGDTLILQAKSTRETDLVTWWILDESGLRDIGQLPQTSISNPLIWSQDNAYIVLTPAKSIPFPDAINFYRITVATGFIEPIQLDETASFISISADGSEIIYDFGAVHEPEYALYSVATGKKESVKTPAGSRHPHVHTNSNSLLIKDFSECTADVKDTFRFIESDSQKSKLEIACTSGLYFGDFSLSPNSCTLAYTIEDLTKRRYSLVLAELC